MYCYYYIIACLSLIECGLQEREKEIFFLFVPVNKRARKQNGS